MIASSGLKFLSHEHSQYSVSKLCPALFFLAGKDPGIAYAMTSWQPSLLALMELNISCGPWPLFSGTVLMMVDSWCVPGADDTGDARGLSVGFGHVPALTGSA